MKILSISDVITNSSSEVFTIYDEQSVRKLKNLVNEILKVGGSSENFDALFDIEFDLDINYVKDVLDLDDSIPNDVVVQEALNNNNDGYPLIDGIIVTAKHPKNNKVAKLLSNIDEIFKHEERYD